MADRVAPSRGKGLLQSSRFVGVLWWMGERGLSLDAGVVEGLAYYVDVNEFAVGGE